MLPGMSKGTAANRMPTPRAAASSSRSEGLTAEAGSSGSRPYPRPQLGNPTGHDDESHHQEAVRDDILEAGAHEQNGEVLQSAQDNDRKTLKLKRSAEVRREAEQQGEQTTGKPREGCAEAERQRADALGVDAHEQRGLRILDRRAQGLPDIGVSQHEMQQTQRRKGDGKHDQSRQRESESPHDEGLVRVGGDD